MSFEQVVLSCLNKIITRLNDLLSVSQLTETSRNVPKRTKTERNGPKRTYKTTETDFRVYRNGLYSVLKRSRMWFQLTQKRIQWVPGKVGQVMVENKCKSVVEVGR